MANRVNYVVRTNTDIHTHNLRVRYEPYSRPQAAHHHHHRQGSSVPGPTSPEHEYGYKPEPSPPRMTTTSSTTARGSSSSQEKRRRRFKSACPKTIQQRVERVWAQRFFCVDRAKTSEISEEFSVLGSTGNVYTITIDHEPSCSCPDAQKGNHCKHLLFVLLKVLQVHPHSNLWYQAGLLTSELQDIFENARPAPQDEQTRRAQTYYRQVTGTGDDEAANAEAGDGDVKKRVPEDGDACPVCYEDYTPGKVVGLVFCKSCGNGLHKDCFKSWAKQQNTCVMCRAPWVDNAARAPRAGPSVSQEGYLNLGASLGISQNRDISTYHQPWVAMTGGGQYSSNYRRNPNPPRPHSRGSAGYWGWGGAPRAADGSFASAGAAVGFY